MGWGATVVISLFPLISKQKPATLMNISFFPCKLGGGVSPRLRFTNVKMTENKGDCAPDYTQDQFGVATMICGAPTHADPIDGKNDKIIFYK